MMSQSLQLDISLCDEIWQRIRDEAQSLVARDVASGSYIQSVILDKDSFSESWLSILTLFLADERIGKDKIHALLSEVLRERPHLPAGACMDIQAVLERDPACTMALMPLLYFKGFHALSVYRFANALWEKGRVMMPLHLQSRASTLWGVDIHPGATIGSGIMMDHATGIVIGETAVVEDDVSIFHGVTLGGTGLERGDRHPKVRRGVLLGAGAKVLGNVEIGAGAQIGAGSVVTRAIPAGATAVGIPARVVVGQKHSR